MPRPFDFIVYEALERLLGPQSAAGCLEAGYRFQFGGSARPAILANLRRVLRHREGAEPSLARLEALLGDLAACYTRSQIAICTSARDPKASAQGVEAELWPALKGLLAGGKGAILATPHFGDVNALMCLPILTGVPMTVVMLYAAPYRASAGLPHGIKLVSLGRSAAACLAALRANELVLLYSDLDFHPDERRAEFFGAPCLPPHGPARLALASGAPILPSYALIEGTRRRLACSAPLPAEGATQESLEEGLLRSMEDFIGRYPAQWLMLRDFWDLEASRLRNRRHLRLISLLRAFDRLLGKADV